MKNLKKLEELEAKIGRNYLEQLLERRDDDETERLIQQYKVLAMLSQDEIMQENDRLGCRMMKVFDQALWLTDDEMDASSEAKVNKIQEQMDALSVRQDYGKGK